MQNITRQKLWRKLIFMLLSLFLSFAVSAQDVLMTQGFDNGGTMPTGWAKTTISGSDALSFVTTSSYPSGFNPYQGSHMVRFASFSFSSAVNRLYSTAGFSTIGKANITVNFSWLESTSYATDYDNVVVQWSTNGTTWHSSGTYNRLGPANAWTVKSDVLPVGAENQPLLYIGFLFTSDYGYDCYLDNVVVQGTSTAPPPVTIQIGTGTNTSSYPFNTYWHDSRTQMLFTAAQIAAAGGLPGDITSIAFNVASAAPQVMNGFNIDMQNYSGSTITSWVNSGWTNVYSGAPSITSTGWKVFDLTTPFNWNGTSNILINICFDNTSYTSATTVYSTAMSDYTINDYTDGAAGCALNYVNNQTNRPNILMTIQPPVVLPTGIVQGFVTNGYGVPLPGATVVAVGENGTFSTTSAANGSYIIDDISIGTYTMSAGKAGYNTITVNNVIIYTGATTYQNFALTQPSMAVTPNPYTVTVNPNELYQGSLNIANNGNGPLGWEVEVEYIEIDNVVRNYPDYTSVRGSYPEVNSVTSPGRAPQPAPYQLDYEMPLRNPTDMAYCYVAYSGTSSLTQGPASFILNNPANITRFGNAASDFIATADWVNDTWYGVVYGGQFLTINPTTGAYTVLGTTGDFVGISYNFQNETMYGLTYDGSLRSVNLANGATTNIGSAGVSGFIAFEIDNDGVAYAVRIDTDQLGTINLTNGQWTSIGSIGFDASYAQDMSCDPSTNELYWAAYDVSLGGKLLIVNKTNGSSQLVGSFPGGAEMTGFAIPGTAGLSGWLTFGQYEGTVNAFTNFNLPAYFNAEGAEAGEVYLAHATFTSTPNVGTVTVPVTMIIAGPALVSPQNLTAVLSNPVTGQVNLSWTIPSTTGLLNFVVKRDGVTVGTTNNLTFTNILPTFGTYSYTVQAVYAEGASVPAGPVEVEWPNPTMFVDPLYIYDEVWVNNTAVQTVTIRNTGQGTLAFQFPDWVNDDSPRAPLAYCTASGGCDEHLNRVQFNTIDNSSGCSGYADYTSISTELEQGETYAFTATNPNPWSSDIVGVWFDWNQNESFTDPGEFYSTTVSGGGASFFRNITVPEGIPSGPTRMRVRLQYGGTLTPCGSTTFGEVEDYTVNVKMQGFITAVTPASGTIPQGGSKTIKITWDATDYAPGQSYFQDLVVTSNDLAHPSATIVNEMYVYVPSQIEGTVTDILTGEPLNGVVVTANPEGTYHTYVLDDNTYENGLGFTTGGAGLGNLFNTTDAGVITKVDAFMYYGGAMTFPLTVGIYDNNGNLLGNSNPVTVTNTGWYSFTLPNVPFTGNFYAVLNYPVLSGSIRYLGLDQNGPNSAANLAFGYSGGTFIPLVNWGFSGVFMLRPTAFIQGSTQAVVYEPGVSQKLDVPENLVATNVSGSTSGPGNQTTRNLVSFQTVTDENGEYSMYVDPGNYAVLFEKTGYQSHVVHNVFANANQTVVVNAQLREESYPPSFVHAEVNEPDTQVEVTWGNGMGPYEIIYDDGSAENFTAWALPGNMNAVKFTPASYPATVIGGKIYVGDGSFPNNNTGFIGTTFGAMVKLADGPNGMPGTTVDSIQVVVTNYGWLSFTGLNAEITSGNFYLVMVQGTISPNTAPVGVDQTNPTLYRSYSRNVVAGGAWGLSPYQDMMIRAIVFGTPGATDAIVAESSSQVLHPVKQMGLISQSPALASSGVEGTGSYKAAIEYETPNRAITGYRVVRFSNFNPNGSPEAGTATLLANNVSGNEYTDNAWAALAPGWYAYGVAALYPGNYVSDTIPSNIVGHRNKAVVTINVALTTGGSPEGAFVSLTGLDYPYSVFSATIPASGQVIFDSVWYGNYTIFATKVGFDDYTFNANIQSNRTFNIMLAETKYKPTNLYVDDLTLVATWRAPMFIKLTEDFEGAVFPPAGWSTYTQNTNGWYAGTTGSSGFPIPAHTTFAVANDDEADGDGCCDYLWTPQMDFTDSEAYIMRFQSFFTGAYSQTAYVEISTDAGATWTVIRTMVPSPVWQEIEIDLTPYAGPNGLSSAWIAFHANDNGTWASGWAVDDVRFFWGVDPTMGYGVFLDGTLVDNTMVTTYTYTNLNYGQEYLAGVACLYSSGYSELDTYRFRSRYLPPPVNLAGENPQDTRYVHLTWEQPIGGGGTGGSLFEDFEAGALSEGWSVIQTNTVSTGPSPAYWTVNSYSSASFGPIGSYHAGLWWDYGHQDEWLITPPVSIGSGTVMSFETTVYEGSTYNDHYHVKVSTDNGATWTSVWDAAALTGNGWNYYAYPYNIDLSAYAGQSVKIAFNAHDGDGQGLWYVWFVDNISIGNADNVVNFRGSDLEHISNGSGISIRGANDQIARDGNTRAIEYTADNNRAVAGLMGYNVYKANTLLAYVPHPTLEYYDHDLDPGSYTYHITAVYDLTPYGFAGQTGESMIEGPVTVNVIYGYALPFVENFTTGLFSTNDWTVQGANWHIAGQSGNPAPSAEFSYNPAQTDYSLGLTSSWINGIGNNGAGFIDGKIYLDFDIKLDDNTATGNEALLVEVYNGTGWTTFANIKAEGDFDWTSKHINISSAAMNKVFKVRFNAKGASSLNIVNWRIDNIHIYRLCEPPTNLEARIPDPSKLDQILLEWEAPGNSNIPGTWLKWDSGTNNNSIGLNGGGTFSAAARFTPLQLEQYAGTSLTKVRFFPVNSPGATFVLKVWTGANASTLVVNQPIPSVTFDQWNEITIDNPVFVTGSNELWFGYTVTHAANQWPGGTDAGPAVAGFGDMISTDGVSWDPMSTFDLNFNWNLQGFVESFDGVVMNLQPIAQSPFNNSTSVLAINPAPNTNNPNATAPVRGPRVLSGYNVYREGEMIANTSETHYLDTDPTISVYGSTWCYTVTAVYEDCESEMTEAACETVINVINPVKDAISIYPNPSNSVVNIVITNDISQVVIYNYLGQVVNDIIVTKDKNIAVDVRNYDAGAYLVKFITRNGESFSKKVVVTK